MVDIILQAFESMNKKEKTDGIRLPVTVVIILVLAVLGIILGQVADVIDYCQEEEPRILRIVIRSISTFGGPLLNGTCLTRCGNTTDERRYQSFLRNSLNRKKLTMFNMNIQKMKHLLKVILVAVVILAFCFGLYLLSDLWDAPVLRFLNYTIIGAASGIYAGPRLAPEVDKEKYRMTSKKWILSIVGVIVVAALLSWLIERRLW